MKNSSKLLERICKRVRRKTRSKDSKKQPKEHSDTCRLGTQKQKNSVSSSQLTARRTQQVPCGAFQDSTVHTCPMAAAEGFVTAPISLPARMDDRASTSSAPLLRVQLPSECSLGSNISTSAEECVQPNTLTAVHPSRMKMCGAGGKSSSAAAGSQSEHELCTELGSKELCMLSATDSGLYSEEEEEGGSSEEEFLEVFSDQDEDEDGLVEDGWLIPAEEVSLDQVVTSNNTETVYSGYWHGNVAVHARFSNSDETRHSILTDISTLSNIRHESIQLFLGACHDLHSDYISIVMDQMKGESLHTLIHKQNHKFSFQRLTKITSQIAQGMEYLHAKGIPHPLLTTHSVTLHFRACISMLTPGSASVGVINTADLPYLPPEVMRTVAEHSSTSQTGLTCPSSPHSVRGLQSRCSSTSSRLSYRLPSSTGWSSPSSPSLRHTRRQVGSTGYLSPDGPVYSNRRGSYDDLRGDGQCRHQRVQLKGDVELMQTFQANVFSFGTFLYELLTLEKPFATTPGNRIIYQVGKGSVHDLSTLRDGKFKQTIRRCWRTEPDSRPSFQELLSTFEQNMSPKACGLKAHFSFSVPDQLNKLGCFDNGGLHLRS